ncbi:MAG: hypothetical protein KIS66_10810 [Fimbriimonadaceae bacterium]|nr:hypothetical protein [Fimbriimonadaceae bacterium]
MVAPRGRPTLLIGSPGVSWRETIRDEFGDHDFLCLDPAQPDFSSVARIVLWRDGKVRAWRFFGSLDLARFPHVALEGLVRLLRESDRDVAVLCPAYRPGPVLRHLLSLIAWTACPGRILIADGTPIGPTGWPVGPETVYPAEAYPDLVQAAQRRATWLRILERCEDHTLDFSSLAFEGSRLGTGRRVERSALSRSGLPETLYAEICGPTLFLVGPEELDESALSRGLDHFGCTKAHIVRPADYTDLVCSFARDSGQDFGFGFVQELDPATGVVRVRCTAVAPAPVRVLRLGALRVSEAGRELGETRPWQV